MDNVVAAGLLGLSFGNLWLCVLLVLSLTSTNRSTCAGYLVGRAVAILALSVLVSLLGRLVIVETSWLNLASGVLLAGFAVYLIATRLLGWVVPWRRAPEPGLACNGACAGCAAHEHPEAHAMCQDCHDEKLCDAEEPEVRELTGAARGMRGRLDAEAGRSGFLFGMGLGGLRGAAVCTKLIVLVPLLLQAGLGEAVLMALAFTLTSSLYPVLGFLFGDWALRLVKGKKALVTFGALALLVTGGFYLVKGAMALG